jgi:hypothetical protein
MIDLFSKPRATLSPAFFAVVRQGAVRTVSRLCQSCTMRADAILEKLAQSDEPSIRWKARSLLGESTDDVRTQIPKCPRVRKLLARHANRRNVYDKWQGDHWILSTLADIGHPPDAALAPIRDRVLDLWLGDSFTKEFTATKKSDAYKHDGVPIMQGRYRRCASQQGTALFATLRLGLADERVHRLVELLLRWQWPDGGWNCDKDPSASVSSFIHTLWTVRGLALYAETFDARDARAAAKRGAEVLLSRSLYRRRTNGKIIHPEFALLHYPLYWHYDVLGALKVMSEAGFIDDARCSDALDWLERKVLPDGGWPAEKSYYKVSQQVALGADWVDWGGTSKKRMNEWVTIDALTVLARARRLA